MAMGFIAGAQDKPREEVAAALPTVATGTQAEFLEELAYYEQPYARFPRVRSIGEVYTQDRSG
jgi:hypothetical protein